MQTLAFINILLVSKKKKKTLKNAACVSFQPPDDIKTAPKPPVKVEEMVSMKERSILKK